MIATENKTDTFDQHKPRLFGIAYRMLGTRDDAEDILQEAYIRWHTAEVGEIESPEAWLVSVVTRLAIDRLRKAYVQRETYIGPWLPEPVVIDPTMSPELKAELKSDVSMAFLVMLERLSPLERAVFLLHDVFDMAYAEIARTVEKSEEAVRQIISRARQRVRSDKTRFVVDEKSRESLIQKFIKASYAGDEKTLMSIFADDVALTSDGGGIVSAARKTIYGRKRLTRLYTITIGKLRDSGYVLTKRMAVINSEPGIIEFLDGNPFAATTFSIADDKITSVYRVMNPEKLKTIENLMQK
jgi:RNA polymerase sigma-70 factor (ECF subfamily)